VALKGEMWCETCIHYYEQQASDERRMREVRELEERFYYEGQK
jgi:hypothetical protein